jgi:hypothetical protein
MPREQLAVFGVERCASPGPPSVGLRSALDNVFVELRRP